MDEVVAAIGAAAGGDAEVTYEPAPLAFPSAYDTSAFERRLGGFRLTPFEEGVTETVETFRAAVEYGRLDADGLLARR
jgi:nucleoside-diphosphate-sugar epimerase